MLKTRRENYEHHRLVYNRTNETFTCYNNEGSFVELKPSGDEPLPEYEHGIVYIVTETEYRKIKATGRNVKDLVRVVRADPAERGRGDIEIVYLESYEKNSNDKHIRIIPCSVGSYVRNDPDENVHHVLPV